MKKIVLYFSLLVSIVFFTACELNEYPTFDNSEAFVAFTAERFAFNEDVGTFKIPVRFTSLGTNTTTVAFEIFNGTAVSGRDFQLSGGATVINFDGTDPVKNINFDILAHEGVFTGDLTFGIAIKSASDVNIGSIDTTYVTILDIDHPLAAILGNYTGSGLDAWDGSLYSWDNVVFEKDEADVTKVWIRNVFAGYAVTLRIYGIVNDDQTEIAVPVHQSFGPVSGYNGYFEGATIPFSMMAEGERLYFSINTGTGVIALKGAFQAGVGAYAISSGAFAGWFERVSELTYVKR